MALIHNATFDSQTRVLSLLDKAGNVISSCEVPSKSNELTLKATEDNSSVKLTKVGTLNNTYEVNTGSGWTAYKFDTVIPLNAGQGCKWRCSAHPTTQSTTDYVQFVMTGGIEASGFITSMVASNFIDMTSLSGYNYAFYKLFSGCTSLTYVGRISTCYICAPYCYYGTFDGCENLKFGSPISTSDRHVLATGCFMRMYANCTNLIGGFASGANLENNCFYEMFYNCPKLCLASTNATTMGSATNAFYNWLYGASPNVSGAVYAHASLGLPTNSYSGIPSGWKRVEP